MLEHGLHQASGLLGVIPPCGPRLIAMVSHGDEHTELPLLWQLCLALVKYGYTVGVLDATSSEAPDNPGLEQLLADAPWSGGHAGGDTPEWAIFPATRGVRQLCATPQSQDKLHAIGQLFASYSVVVLYSPAPWLASLLASCRIAPLLAVAPTRRSLLTGYQALKRLLLTAGLQPTIVNVADSHQAQAQADFATSNLSVCARNFLGYEAHAITITETTGDGALERLALRLLEGAMTLHPHNLIPIARDATMEPEQPDWLLRQEH